MTLSVGVELTGEFFTKDPGQTIRQNIERLMGEIAREGADNARSKYLAGAGGRALVRMTGDRVADHVIGRVRGRPSHGGRQWHASGVIQVYNEGMGGAQSRSLMAAASYLEGRFHIIRDVTRQAGARLRQIDLAKGLGD